MLKIKDDVDLKELEKFGYELGEKTRNIAFGSYGKVFREQLDNWLVIYDTSDMLFIVQINEKKEIELNITVEHGGLRSFSYKKYDVVEPYIKDLLNAGLVEIVEE